MKFSLKINEMDSKTHDYITQTIHIREDKITKFEVRWGQKYIDIRSLAADLSNMMHEYADNGIGIIPAYVTLILSDILIVELIYAIDYKQIPIKTLQFSDVRIDGPELIRMFTSSVLEAGVRSLVTSNHLGSEHERSHGVVDVW